MSKYIDLIETFLTEEDWFYNTCKAEGGRVYLRVPFTGKHCHFDIVCDADDADDLIMVFIYPTIYVPTDKQSLIAELICRLNHHIVLGNFEFDFADSVVRFKSAIDIEGAELTSTLFFNLFKNALLTMDQSFPSFMALLYGNLSPQESTTLYLQKSQDKQPDDVKATISQDQNEESRLH